MQVVGVTGTNGKTTVATLLYRLFSALGYRCGLLSTVRIYIGDESYDTRHTTPDPILLQRWLARMREQQCQYCFMEVSSHAAHQRRIDGMVFQGGIFTNITQDHLDYHPTFQDYLLAKKRFFDLLPADAFALSNRDDRNGRVMVQDTAAQPYYYALRTQADFHIRIQEKSLEGLLLRFNDTAAYCRLTGVFNAYNLGAVYGAARLLGIEKQQLLTTLSSLAPIEGRFEVIRVPAGPIGIVDYAHTPDALKNVLRTIWDVSQASRQLITVIGCGGERDKDKRPQMAKTALDYSDRLILTSDNPRHEDPEAILADMERGVPVAKQRKVLKISDRREAIKAATQLAQPGDVVLIAGKGHEPYQEIKGVRFDFSDRQEFLQAIQPTQS
jgi:UDP-N-acetylmuramoyl-L-alanyl-D-glutamate--2,6-diaminopimelate ligase